MATRVDLPPAVVTECISVKIAVYQRKHNTEDNQMIREILKTDIEALKKAILGITEIK